jgi:hypothetical protein
MFLPDFNASVLYSKAHKCQGEKSGNYGEAVIKKYVQRSEEKNVCSPVMQGETGI